MRAFDLLWIVPLCIVFGFLLFKSFEKQKEEKINMEAEKEPEHDEELDPMKLRNGFGVTRAKDPTFAEQWVNIMNYNGENQTEVDYEEDESD